jgi:hypothetical protein
MEVFMQNDSYDNRIDQDIARCKQDISKAAGQQTSASSPSGVPRTVEQNKSSQPQKSNLSAKGLPKAESSLRVMPAFEDILKNKTAQTYPPVQSAGSKEFVRQMVEKISQPQQQDRSGEMPSLDLSQQILAQQRKIAALKRKSPLQNGDSSINSRQIHPNVSQISSMPPTPASPQQRIIADIVAKEIMILASAR